MILSGCIFARDALRTLPAAVLSLTGHVDRLLVLIDERTADSSQAWCEGFASGNLWPGFTWDTFTFTEAGGFGGAMNEVRARAGGDWAMILDADETIDQEQAARLRTIAAEAELAECDCVGFARHNWRDLARTDEDRANWPDWQWRLTAAHVRYVYRAHPGPLTNRRIECPAERLAIHHFNLALRTEADWAAVNEFYRRQIELDVADGRVWPGGPAVAQGPASITGQPFSGRASPSPSASPQ